MGSRRIKFVERGGRTLESLLCRTNPWKGGRDASFAEVAKEDSAALNP